MASRDELHPMTTAEDFSETRSTRVILVGNSGSGKSTLGNILLQRDDVILEEEVGATPSIGNDPSEGFVVGKGFDPGTTKCHRKENVNAWGIHIQVVDTPGLLDPGEKTSQEQLLEAASLASPGPHAILFVTRCDTKFPPEEKTAFDIILDTFAEEARERLIVVFTRGESLEGRPVEKLFERAPQSLKDVMAMVGDNYAVISKTDDAGVRERELQRLLKKIDDVSEHRTTYFVHEDLTGMDTVSPAEAAMAGHLTRVTRVVVVGKTGSGKSTLGNILLQNEVFKVSGNQSSTTSKCDYRISNHAWGRCMQVVDTPGLYDTSQDPGKTLKELTNVLSLSSPGPHAILFLTRRDQKFTKEEYESFMQIRAMFGDKKNRFLVLVFSRGEPLAGKTIEDDLKGAPESLKKVIKLVGNKCAVISNTHDELERKQEVEEILKKVDQASKNGTRYYRNDDLKKMMKLINDEIEKVKEEKNIEWCEAELEVKRGMVLETKARFKLLKIELLAVTLFTRVFATAVGEDKRQKLIESIEKEADSRASDVTLAQLGKYLKKKEKEHFCF